MWFQGTIVKRASRPYEDFFPHHVWAQNASFEVLILLNTIPEVPRRPIQELFQVFFPWDQVRTGPTSHEYEQGPPRRPQEPRVWGREQEETSPYPLRTHGRWGPRSHHDGKSFFLQDHLPDKTKFSVPIWDTGNQEAFLIHVQQAKSACKRKGLFQDYDDAILAETKSMEQAKSLQKAIANAIGPKSKKDAKDPNQSSPDDLKASLKDALLAWP